MSRLMGPPALPVAATCTMRLTVEVLPLAAEHAHGPSRAQAMADIKGRKFALPVQWTDTFRNVWAHLEARYKKNYLSAEQAAAFTIYKLQDAYDCDLDLDDTVESIFAGEADPAMRMVKVVPSFTHHRHFSVPATSNLRPALAQKRAQNAVVEPANKRRRIQQPQPQPQLHATRHESNTLRDQPMPTTESEPSGADDDDDDDSSDEAATHASVTSRSSRSYTGASLVYVNGGQTGDAEFGPVIKDESPELGLPRRQPTPEAAPLPASRPQRLPSVPVRNETPRLAGPRKTKSPSRTLHRFPSAAPQAQAQAQAEVLQTNDVYPQPDDEPEPEPEPEPQPSINTIIAADAALLRSPESTPSHIEHVAPRVAPQRKDIYDVPSSPEFVAQKHKATAKITTYGHSPRTVRKEAGLVNGSRRSSHQSDQIDSTPQEDEAVSRRSAPQNGTTTPVKTPKRSDLRRPSSALRSAGKLQKQLAATSSPRSILAPLDDSILHRVDPAVRARVECLQQQTLSPQAPKQQAPTIARLSTQPSVPRASPRRTPVPLPANVRNTFTKATSTPSNGTASDADIFKKPTARQNSATPHTAQKTTPWNADSWSFGNIDAHKSAAKEPLSNQEANARLEASSRELCNGSNETTLENGLAHKSENQSPSASPAASNRSSPALTRRPARFISHSPTPEGSDAEDCECDEASASPSKAAEPRVPASEGTGNSDTDSDICSDSETDTELPNASKPQPSSPILGSSPPQPRSQVPKSTPIVPETSQPTPSQPQSSQIYRRTPIPLPPSRQIPSTAPPALGLGTKTTPVASTATSVAKINKTPMRPPMRPHNSQFSALKDQLDYVNRLTGRNGKSDAALDVRTMDLGKLAMRKEVPAGAAAKKKPIVGGIAVGLLGTEESSDEESESSSDSD